MFSAGFERRVAAVENVVRLDRMRRVLALAVALVGCDAKPIEQKVARDAVAQYEMTKRSGATDIDLCAQAGMVSAAFLQAQDETEHKRWKAIEKENCTKAGVPQ